MIKRIPDLFDYFDVRTFESYPLLVGSCPIHDGDNPAAFNINIDPESKHYGLWFCNTHFCHLEKSGQDIFGLIHALLSKEKKTSFKQMILFCNDFLEKTPEPRKIKRIVKNEPVQQKRITRQQIRDFLTFPAKQYIERGFKEETLDHFDVGVCYHPKSKMYKRIVFPVFDEDDQYMVGCVGRTINGHSDKWKNLKGFNKSNFLYNYAKALPYINDSKAIILVEGQGDVLRFYEAGVNNVVGLFGCTLSDMQEFLIQKTKAKTVILALDNDDAGTKGTNQIKKQLPHFEVIQIQLSNSKDIGDLTIQEIDDFVKPQMKGFYL